MIKYPKTDEWLKAEEWDKLHPITRSAVNFMRDLARENARLQKQVEIDDKAKRVMVAENARLRKDRERLDWMEQTKAKCGHSETTYIGEAYYAFPAAMADKYDASKTLRGAIDAAMCQG